MGRMKRTDSRFEFRADIDDIEWFKEFCRRKGTTASEEIRKFLKSVRRQAERAQRPEPRQAPEKETTPKRENHRWGWKKWF